MEFFFDSKARRVGSSLGFLIPQNAVEKARISEGSEVKVFIVKKDLREINRAFGLMKGAKPLGKHL